MPELPEVETTRLGIEPHLIDQRIARVVVRDARLRWRVPKTLATELPGQRIKAVTRRAKYLLLVAETGTVIVHLGMSGRLRITNTDDPPVKHDHVDFVLTNGACLRLHDPRRFGCVLWTTQAPDAHKLLKDLGPEPLEQGFSAQHLYQLTRGRSRAIRDVLLDPTVVAGVGNIYANEALFTAGIRPGRPAGRLSLDETGRLVRAVRTTLKSALRARGTTLRDYRSSDGSPGYFQLSLKVYGRAGQACGSCRTAIRLHRLGQRSAYYCGHCQT